MMTPLDAPGAPAPIAMVGMGCRFGGGATDPQKLWKLLEEGGSAWSKIPPSRFNVGGVYHPNGQRVGSVSMRHAWLSIFEAHSFLLRTIDVDCE